MKSPIKQFYQQWIKESYQTKQPTKVLKTTRAYLIKRLEG